MIIKQELAENPLMKVLFQVPYYRLLFQSFTSEKLTQLWFSKIKNLPFEKSHFGINQVGKQQRVYDDSVRLSQYVKADIPELDEIATYYLQCWSDQSIQTILTGGQFNCLRYPNGHFAWHMDKVRPKEGYEHMGTIIVIPPSNLAKYVGGTLVIVDLTNQQLHFDPSQNQWVFIIIPLGYMHNVEQVVGMRYSFTRQIYFKQGHSMRKMTDKDKMQIMKEHRLKKLQKMDKIGV